MLGKLIKYDLKFIYKQLIIFYIIILCLAIVARATENLNSNFLLRFLHGFAEGAAFGFAFGMIINASMRMWAKYKFSIYGDQAYLTHTLPLSKRTIWTAKFLTSLIVIAISSLLFLACLLIMYLSPTALETIGMHWQEFWPLATTLVLAVFCQLCFVMQCGLLGVTIGHCFNSHRNLWSVIFGLGIYLTGGLLLLGGATLWAQFDSGIDDFLFRGFMDGGFPIIATRLLTGCSGAYILFIVSSYFANYGLLQRGVNVD